MHREIGLGIALEIEVVHFHTPIDSVLENGGGNKILVSCLDYLWHSYVNRHYFHTGCIYIPHRNIPDKGYFE
jgi:hypothetical protein